MLGVSFGHYTNLAILHTSINEHALSKNQIKRLLLLCTPIQGDGSFAAQKVLRKNIQSRALAPVGNYLLLKLE